jgi:NIPSNAP
MIHELRSYTLVPGKLKEAVALSEGVARPIRRDDYGKLEGYWTVEFGTLNRVVHLWSFAGLDERARLRQALGQNEAWKAQFLPRFLPLLVRQESKVLSPVRPVAPPEGAGLVYELRTYRAKAGRAPEFARLLAEMMPLRERFSRNVGLWLTEIGPLNEVVHLWAYRDLVERASVRARVLEEPEWQGFQRQALPLLEEMRSEVLLPASFSPMR